MSYQEFYNRSIQNPTKFWKEHAQNLAWYREPQNILSENEDGYHQWFTDGKLNLSYLCIDKHIEDGYGRQNAMIYDSPVTNTKEIITYNRLYKEVSQLAGVLKEIGLKKGDTAIIYMPMIPQAVYAMLACARIGVIHSVVFGPYKKNVCIAT